MAHLRGSLDFREPRRFDWRWQLKETLVLDTLEDQLVHDMNTLVFQWHCAAAQVTGWDDKEQLFDYHSGQARHSYNVMGKTLLPWYKQWWTAETNLATLWTAFKNEEKDPVYAAYLKSIRDGMAKEVQEREDRARSAELRAAAAIEERKQREAEIRKRKEKRYARLRQ